MKEFNGYLEQHIRNKTQQDLIKTTYYPLSDFPEATYNGSAASNGPITFSSYTMRWVTMNADCCFICNALWYAQKLTENNNAKHGAINNATPINTFVNGWNDSPLYSVSSFICPSSENIP